MSKRVVLGQAVKAIREAKKQNQPDEFRQSVFAIKCLMTPGHFCNVEAGRKPATEDTIRLIAAHLGVSVDAISYEVADARVLVNA